MTKAKKLSRAVERMTSGLPGSAVEKKPADPLPRWYLEEVLDCAGKMLCWMQANEHEYGDSIWGHRFNDAMLAIGFPPSPSREANEFVSTRLHRINCAAIMEYPVLASAMEDEELEHHPLEVSLNGEVVQRLEWGDVFVELDEIKFKITECLVELTDWAESKLAAVQLNANQRRVLALVVSASSPMNGPAITDKTKPKMSQSLVQKVAKELTEADLLRHVGKSDGWEATEAGRAACKALNIEVA